MADAFTTAALAGKPTRQRLCFSVVTRILRNARGHGVHAERRRDARADYICYAGGGETSKSQWMIPDTYEELA